MSAGGIIIVTVVAVLVLGLLVFTLMRRSQKVVPRVTGEQDSHRDRAVAVGDDGRPIMESEVGEDEAPRDDSAFDAILEDELDDQRG